MSSNTLEIIQGLAQAAANAYDGAHDERFVREGEDAKVGLRREEGCPIMDRRVNDGFGVKFYGNMMCLTYQSDIKLKEVHSGKFENEINRMLNEIKKFLQKEYKKVTGNSITLTADGEADILVQSTSRVRSFVNAKQHYKISALDSEPIFSDKERKIDQNIRDFLAQATDKRPKNDTRGKNQ
tara:strand:+ start:355 stop:900 length:546 start_codon:yes stop_codon:yes gene_type:complete